MGNELNVDLRLQLRKLREDIAQASKLIKEGLSKTLNLGGGDADKATKSSAAAMDNLHTKTRRVNSALADQLNAWKKLQNFRKPNIYIYGQTAMPKADYSQYGPTMNPTQGPMGPGGGMATGSPYMGNVPPVIPRPVARTLPIVPPISTQDASTFWRKMITGSLGAVRGGAYGNIIAANQMFGAFSGTATGGRAMGAMGLAGSGGAAAATGGLIVAIGSLVVILKAVQKVYQATIAASERARNLYSKALTGGLGLQFTSQRGMLAQTLGVSENDVYQFGAAIAILNPRLEHASKISAAAATALAPLNYDLSVLKFDMMALFDSIATTAAPAIRTMVQALDALVKVSTDFLNNFVKPAGRFILDTINSKAGRMVMKTLVGNAAGDQVAAMMADVARVFSSATGAQRGIDQPNSFMKQLPVSTWERMGLVTGMSSNSIADYTRRTAVATEAIVRHITTSNSRPIPSAAFGMSPFTSNP